MRQASASAARGMLCFGLLSLIGPALAGSISVNPIRVTLTAAKAAGALVVRNSGADPSVVQIEVMSWSQQDGRDVLVPTRELLATPPIFTVPAGGSQTVRVGLRQGVDPRREVSYRVIMQEVPPPPKPEFRGLQVALRLSVPVFVPPAVVSAAPLQWQATRNSQGDLQLSVSNPANIHVQIIRVKLSVDGKDLAPRTQLESAYVLPDQRREWTLRFDPAPAVGTVLHLAAQTDAGDVQSDLVVK